MKKKYLYIQRKKQKREENGIQNSEKEKETQRDNIGDFHEHACL